VAVVRGFASAMSEVFSFRLNKDNSREARALKALKRWQEEGYKTRFIVTEALLLLDDSDKIELKVVVLAELNEKLSHLSRIFNQIEYKKTKGLLTLNPAFTDTELSNSFLISIKETAKPGRKFEKKD